MNGIAKSEKQAYSQNRGPHVNIDGKVDITADGGEKTNDEAKERFRGRKIERKIQVRHRQR